MKEGIGCERTILHTAIQILATACTCRTHMICKHTPIRAHWTWTCILHCALLASAGWAGMEPPAGIPPSETEEIATDSTATVTDEAGVLLEAGDALFESDPEKALGLYQKAVKDFPEDARAHWRVAVALAQLNRYGEGRTALEKAVVLDPSLKDGAKYQQLLSLFNTAANPPPPRRANEHALAVATSSMRIQEALALIDRAEQNNAPVDSVEIVRLIDLAYEAIRLSIQDPEMSDLEIWEIAGRIALFRKDDTLAAFAFEAISRLDPEYASSPGRLKLMAALNRTGINDDVAQIRLHRPRWMEQRHRALAGDREAQFAMGRDCHFREWLVAPPDDVSAFEWFKKAAEAGHTTAQYNLGLCYHTGSGVDKDPEQAVVWYRKAAEAGHAGAQSNLGLCYHTGSGVDKDPEQAVVWYRKAAEAGQTDAQFNLGRCYETGFGVDEDPEKAVVWYRKAAEAGHDKGMYRLGYIYTFGLGVPQNSQKGDEWLKKAAREGNLDAQILLQNSGESW